MRLNSFKIGVSQLWLVALIVGFGLLPMSSVQAADAGPSYMRCSRMMESEAPGNCLIVFTTSATVAADAFFKLTLDSEWTSATHFSATFTDYTVTTTGIPAGTTAMPGIGTATALSGQSISFPITTLGTNTAYAFIITGGLLDNPTASSTQLHILSTRTSGDAEIDTQTVAVPTIANDQIVITATVAPTFTFVFNNNAQNMGTLSTGSVVSGGGTTVTVTTNAAGGWNAWALSANTALNSVAAGNYTIDTSGSIDAAPTTISAGTEGYVLDVDATTDAGGGGTLSIAGEYNGLTTAAGGTLSSTYQLIASANGAAAGDIVTLIPRATISGLTPAASDYTDTLTVVGAGIF